MLVSIGLMVGFYVMTRMLELLTAPKDRRKLIVTMAAIVTLFVAILCTIDLFLAAITGTTPRGIGL